MGTEPGSKKVLDLCDLALSVPEESRASLLDLHCGEDLALRQAVESLLKAVDDSGSFLTIEEHPPATDDP